MTQTKFQEKFSLPKYSEMVKATLGQILVYSAFYPHHRKRLHLFGRCDELTKVADIETACLAFNVKVTAEEV